MKSKKLKSKINYSRKQQEKIMRLKVELFMLFRGDYYNAIRYPITVAND